MFKVEEHNILLIWDRMGDYHRVRWAALSKLKGEDRVYAADLGTADNLYKWANTSNQRNYVIMSKKSLASFDLFGRIINFVNTVIRRKISCICVPGYGRSEYLLFLVISKIMNKKVVLFAESWYGKNRLKNTIKSLFLNLFVDLIFVSGEKANNHFKNKINFSPRKIISGYSVVDNGHFNVNKEALPSVPIIICVARFSPEKNLIGLINAFKQSKIQRTYNLKLVGGGGQRAELEKLVLDHKNIQLEDWVSYNELPIIYNASSLFILPSLFEPWGLVINEAMAAGLPVIASEQCGCVPDLITEKNGFTFNAENEEELISLLDKIATLPQSQLREMGKVSQKIIAEYSPDIWAKRLIEGMQSLKN